MLEGVAEAWRDRQPELQEAGSRLASSIAAQVNASSRSAAGSPVGDASMGEWMLDAALAALERDFDARNGGWGGAPKFPQPMTIEFLLRMHVRNGDQRALAMARKTLDAMAAGGIYDQLGGGFARYATDSVWLVPHFEKMLYDNAQLGASTSMPGRSPATLVTARWSKRRWSSSPVSYSLRTAGLQPASTRTLRAKRGRRTSGRRRRSMPFSAMTPRRSNARTTSPRTATGRGTTSSRAVTTGDEADETRLMTARARLLQFDNDAADSPRATTRC